MNEIRVLNKEVVMDNLNIMDAISAVEQAYALNSNKEVNLFTTVFYDFEEGKADMDIKSGTIDKAGIFGFKLMSWFDDNTKIGLEPLVGNIMLYDRSTGCPIALLDATHITGMRTGAAGGIGTKYLARKDSEKLLLVGCGNQAPFQLAATLLLMDHIKKVSIYNPINYENAVNFSKKIKTVLTDDFLSKLSCDKKAYDSLEKKLDIDYIPVSDIENATKEADIIITATPSRKPIIMKEWVKSGTHFTCIGADMEGKQEIDENLFSIARVFIDDIEKTSKVGEMETAIKKGLFRKEDIVCEIGDVIQNKQKGRMSEDEITIFDASGLATQDLLTAKILLDKANDQNLGITIQL